MALAVCFDESGNTGEDLLSPHQPVYVLASVSVAQDVARALLESAPRQGEVHFKQNRRSYAGREAIFRILSAPELTFETVKLLGIHKSFMVTAKMVDLLAEPLAHEFGFDLYADGAHLALANLWHAVMPVLASPEAFTQVQASFVEMVRRPGTASRSAFRAAVDAMEESWRGGAEEWAFEVWRMGAELEAFGADNIPDLDPAPTAFVTLAHDWADQSGAFGVIHDQHLGMDRWKAALARLWPEDAQPQVFVRHDGRSFSREFRLPTSSLERVERGSPRWPSRANRIP